ncbi:NAD(P)-dependent alcohol dehydrogenase, partial [Erwinia amylovora]
FGGYFDRIVVDSKFVITVPENLPLNAAAPLLCAGVTTCSPVKHWNLQPGQRVGVIGLGGLCHMAVKLAAALGAEEELFTTSPAQGAHGRRLDASQVVVSTDSIHVQRVQNTLPLI